MTFAGLPNLQAAGLSVLSQFSLLDVSEARTLRFTQISVTYNERPI